MEAFSQGMGDAMRAIVAACQTPVIILLMIGGVVAVVFIGSVVAEFFTEHRRFKVFLPKLVDELKAAGPDGIADVVKASGLLMRQKQKLVELTLHPQYTPTLRESLAVALEKTEQRRYDIICKLTDMGARITPMLGLLATLIPLGPGIIALSAGDTETLSASLTTAFDGTSMGLMEAAVFMLISAVRQRWYKDYMVSFDAATEAIVEILNEGHALGEDAGGPSFTNAANNIGGASGAENRSTGSREAQGVAREGAL